MMGCICVQSYFLLFTNNALAQPVMDCNLCAKFHFSILPGFWDTLIETELQQQREEFWKLTFLNKSITDYAIYAIS